MAEQDFVNATLSVISKDVIIEIMKNMEPKDVLELCKINKRLADICRRNLTFQILLKEHFPQYGTRKDAKKHYMMLANDESTPYDIIEQKGKYIAYAYEHYNGFAFTEIIGAPFDVDTSLWVYTIRHQDDYRIVPISVAYENKQDAIDGLVEEFKDFLIYEEIDEEVEEEMIQAVSAGDLDRNYTYPYEIILEKTLFKKYSKN